ncbi:signal peptidase I S [Clostridium tepidiprofundi DSM 19306]|uniref:Signal peptidase I n=1 Tax=Clostridium tepidiprofundi DSM 19306 TaxID=1121338 RepID=A0A151B3W0_9CLOT|nr:signal peptidase I [Clostridium tepidiprofundi]KYH34576.1 signal peptidase I S [Clostridium tepidiprofundi DSM 19306]
MSKNIEGLDNINEGECKKEYKNKKGIAYLVKDWAIPIVLAIFIALVINKFIFFNIVVPTGSMIPTIMPGDRIFVTRVHNVSNLKRGDIVVFHSDELHKDLIKRLIGLPGDIVQRKMDGSVYVNDKKIDEEYVANDGGPTGVFVVPKEHYLFFGDNRANSYDGRCWKQPFIDKKDIMGKARIIIFPFKRIGVLK